MGDWIQRLQFYQPGHKKYGARGLRESLTLRIKKDGTCTMFLRESGLTSQNVPFSTDQVRPTATSRALRGCSQALLSRAALLAADR